MTELRTKYTKEQVDAARTMYKAGIRKYVIVQLTGIHFQSLAYILNRERTLALKREQYQRYREKYAATQREYKRRLTPEQKEHARQRKVAWTQEQRKLYPEKYRAKAAKWRKAYKLRQRQKRIEEIQHMLGIKKK